MNCVNKCDFGTKCFAKVEHFVLRLILMAFLPAWKKKNNMTLLLFFEVKAVIEEHYERRIEFYRYVNPPLSREAERELGEWKGKVREIMRMC